MQTQVQQKEALELLIRYISGADIESTRGEIRAKNINRKTFKAVKLFSNNHCALDNAELRPLIAKLFYRLNIKDEAQIRALLASKKNLYAILKALLKQQHRYQQNTYQLKLFIELLNEKKKKKKANWLRRIKIAITSVTVGSIIYAIFKPHTYAQFLSKTKNFIVQSCRYIIKNATWMKSLAFIGAVFTGIATLKDIIRILRSHTKSAAKKAKGIFFSLASSGLNTTAYALAIRAGCFCTPISTGLFIAASAVSILKAAYSLFTHYREYHSQYPQGMPDSQDWGERAAFIRSRNSYQQHRATLITKIIGGLLMTGVIASWCIFPPSIVVTAVCLIAAVFVVPALQKWVVKKFKTHYQNKLQHELNNLEGEENIEIASYPREVLQEERPNPPRGPQPRPVQTVGEVGSAPIAVASVPNESPPPYSPNAPYFFATSKDVKPSAPEQVELMSLTV